MKRAMRGLMRIRAPQPAVPVTEKASGTGPLLRKTLLVTVAAVVLLGFSTALASAAPNKPTITFVFTSPAEGATLTVHRVEFYFTYNRTRKQTRTLLCDLSGPISISGFCDDPTAIPNGGSLSHKGYSALPNGSYTFTVSLTLTDGGTRHGHPSLHDRRRQPHRDRRRRRAQLRPDERGRGQVLGLERLRPARRRHEQRGKQISGRRQRAWKRRQRDRRRRCPQLRADERGRGQVLGQQRLRPARRRHEHG